MQSDDRAMELKPYSQVIVLAQYLIQILAPHSNALQFYLRCMDSHKNAKQIRSRPHA